MDALSDKNEKGLKKAVGRRRKERDEKVGDQCTDQCTDRTGMTGIRMDLFEKQAQKDG